jgi:hypothetical protein
VGRERIIERERRWAVPVATAALFALVLYIASFIIEQSANLSTGASEAAQLRSLHDHSGTVLLASIVRAAAFLLVPVPLLYLFRAAQARNPRVHGAMVGFIFIGPLLFGVQGVVQAAGAGQAASDFVEQAPTEHSRSFAEFQKQLKREPRSIDKVTIYTARNQLEVQPKTGPFYSVPSYPEKVQTGLAGDLESANVDHETDTDSGSTAGSQELPGGDALATHITDDSSAIQVAQGILFPAVLGLVVMMIYVPLQAQRVGLLSRFFGSLGMALGASMILILPVALLASLLWMGWLGLLFVGRVPGGRPPAWEAGKAVPWPRPGEEADRAPRAGGKAIEGEATEEAQAKAPALGTPLRSALNAPDLRSAVVSRGCS